MLSIKRLDRVTNDIYDITESRPLIERAQTGQLRFLGHVLRMDELSRLYALNTPTHGNCRPRRQPTLLPTVQTAPAGDQNGQIIQEQIAGLANDRRAG